MHNSLILHGALKEVYLFYELIYFITPSCALVSMLLLEMYSFLVFVVRICLFFFLSIKYSSL